MFNEKTSQSNKYYWVKNKNTGAIIPLLFNIDRQWRVEVNYEVEFFSPGRLRLMYGKECVLREVNFEKDIIDVLPADRYSVKFAPFALPNDKPTEDPHIIFRNDFVVATGGMYIPTHSFPSEGNYLKYNEKG